MSTITVVLMGALAILSCTDDPPPKPLSTPTWTPTIGEFTATMAIDTCWFIPPPSSGALDSLCGESTGLTISFEFVYADETREYIIDDVTIRSRSVTTGPTKWKFTNPRFADVILPLFADKPLVIGVYRVLVTDSQDSRGVEVSVSWPRGSEWYRMRVVGPREVPVDTEGFPIIENKITLSGVVLVEHSYSSNYELARGSGEMVIENVTEIPVDSTGTAVVDPLSN
jgi:hypothetical protein